MIDSLYERRRFCASVHGKSRVEGQNLVFLFDVDYDGVRSW